MTYKELMHNYNIDENYLNIALGIPKRTLQSWRLGERQPAKYLMELITYFVFNEMKEGRL